MNVNAGKTDIDISDVTVLIIISLYLT